MSGGGPTGGVGIWRVLAIFVVLAVFGLVRWPLESAATQSFKERHLLPPDVGLELRERLGQNSFAAVLGGARSLVASIQNLLAFAAWEERDWGRVESHYRVITELQPRVPSYWEMFAWHMAYNAAGYYRYDWRGPGDEADGAALEALRKDLWRRYLDRGREAFEGGVRNNPEDWRLAMLAGQLWSDVGKEPDHRRAAEYFQRAAAADVVPGYVHRFLAYELALLPDRQDEALDMLTRLFEEDTRNHTPSLLGNLLNLQFQAGVPEVRRVPMDAFGPDLETRYHELRLFALSRFVRGTRPSDGLNKLLAQMEEALGVPEGERVSTPEE